MLSTVSSTAVAAPIQEVFSSFQGEGPYVGVRQVFVRFAHCHLKCAYCDTPMTSPTGNCHIAPLPETVAQTSVADDVLQWPNPVGVAQLVAHLAWLNTQVGHHSVSVTGGEPLLYHRFLRELFPAVQALGVKTYLETSGTQADFLAEVLAWVDIVSMDFKLPSSTQEAPQWDNHRAFLETCLRRQSVPPEVFIKLVVNDLTPDSEMEAALATCDAAGLPPETVLILQPETSLVNPPQVTISHERLFSLYHLLAKTGRCVRVIPQTHKMVMVR